MARHRGQRIGAHVADMATSFILGGFVVAGLIYGIDTDPDLNPTTPTPQPSVTQGVTPTPQGTIHLDMGDPIDPGEGGPITDDSPGFNCLTMGNRTCGEDFEPIPADLWETLFPEKAAMTGDDFCLWQLAEQHTLIVCTDGTVITS